MTGIRFWRAVSSLFAIVVGAAFFVHVWSVFLPFLFGGIIAYLVHPQVDRFVSLGFRRDRIVLVLYLILLAAAVVLGAYFIPPLVREANLALSQLPQYAGEVNALASRLNLEIQETVTRLFGDRAPVVAIPFDADLLLQSLFRTLPANLLNVAHLGLWAFIVPFVCYFVLSQGRHWIDTLFNWTPSRYVESLLGLFAEVNATLGGYFRGVLVESGIVAVLTIAGLGLLDVNGAILIGFVTGLLNMVPFLAMSVGGFVALLAAYLQGASTSILFGVALLYIGIRVLDDVFIIPFVMRQNVRLHPVLTLFAILAGVEVGGFVGLVFAIPVAATVKVVFVILFRDKRGPVLASRPHVYS